MRNVIGLLGLSSIALGSCAPVVPANGNANAISPPAMDCALRDAPFSINSPLYDVMLSDPALHLLEKTHAARHR